jgi:(5-formylfuran-3-yl)methyl phosphate synthase
MTRLLVSVRDAMEARTALEAGAHLIDVKDPGRGPLGFPGFEAAEQVVREVAGRVPVSMALGELRDWQEPRDGTFPRGVAYAKLGMADCATCTDWPQQWKSVLDRLPAGVSPVAVVYADWPSASAPEPARIVVEASANHCRAVLVDTFDKSLGSLLDWRTREELTTLVNQVRRLGMLVVLAGSLTLKTIPHALFLGPDYIAVRGAACREGREGPVDASLVRQLVQLLGNSYRVSGIT